MNIKTITCHRVNNHGANLQAYALMHYLENLGHKVEIIDYYPEQFWPFRPFAIDSSKFKKNIIFKLLYLILKLPSRTFQYLKYLKSSRRKNFNSFRSKYYKTTKTYKTYKELKLNPPIADVYFAGSDQIWNTMMKNGKDPAYYLSFAPKGSVRATYAASFSVPEIPDELKGEIKNRISKIDYVSVREQSAIEILDDLDIVDANVVLDPVFLLKKNEWDNIKSNMEFVDDYILVYDFDNSAEVREYAIKYSIMHNLKIYSLYNSDYCDKSFEDFGPDVFLALIDSAKFIVSNSFHATAFSLIFNKNFCVIKRQESINSRMTDLLKMVGLDDRIVNSYNLLDSIEYESVNERIEEIANDSYEYINKVLN